MLGGGVITGDNGIAWDHVSLTAGLNDWHHVMMVYNGAELHFYLDGSPEDHAARDTGDLVVVDNPLFIGQAGTGTESEYFVGEIDEIKILTEAVEQGRLEEFSG